MTSPRFAPARGERFGRLVVQETGTRRSPKGISRRVAICQCDCGMQTTVLTQNLQDDKTRSCGCMKRRGTMSKAFAATRGQPKQSVVDIGQRFGRLVVLQEEHTRTPREQWLWVAHCRCDCGNEKSVAVHNLKGGQTLSCGCLQTERATEANAARATRGMSDHEHYSRWHNMLRRCEEPKDPRYPEWGGRGISVCAEWHDLQVFVAYLESVLGPRPEGYSLDRIDNNGNYEPGNVRWASVVTQRHNQRRMKPKP